MSRRCTPRVRRRGRYYTRYLADAPGEQPGRWLGHQARGLGLTGTVSAADLEALPTP